jgi:uncharacterized repeat protein (TIGR03803 family)
LFVVNTNGENFRILTQFFGSSDGLAPFGVLILSGGKLYGTTKGGGTNGSGTIFGDFQYTFSAQHGSLFTNSDGASPYAGLITSGNILYGTAEQGGSFGNGTVFAINNDGTGFTNLHSFMATPSNPPYTNGEGANPYAGLILSGNTLYGTTFYGGSAGNGTVFAINTNGTDFTNLHSFTVSSGFIGTNSDGANPYACLTLSGNTLYGTTSEGGGSGNGTLFAINTDGTRFTNLYSFTSISGVNNTNSDGGNPYGGLTVSGNTLFGTARFGGSYGNGTVFSLSLPPPQLTIIQTTTNVILTWPTYAPGFTLQSTTNLVPQAVWSTNLTSPVLVN